MTHLKDPELTSALSAQLDGERLLAAAYARVSTILGAARVLTPLGNYLVARPAARSAARKITDRTEVPLDAAVVLGITADALHVWKADPMLNRVGDYLGQVPLSRITDLTVEPGRTWHPLTISLDNGEKVDLEARGAGHAIAAAFRERRKP